MNAPEFVTRHVGNCQICENDQKLDAAGRLVLHGFKRPYGWGSTVGRCFGVGAVPYEVGTDRLALHLAQMRERAAELDAYQARLAAREETSLFVGVYDYSTGRDRLVEYRVGVTEPYRWERAYESKVSEARHERNEVGFEIDRVERRIAAFVARPVRTVEECAEVERKAKDGRRAEREAARAAREAKKAETARKAAERKARRREELDSFVRPIRIAAEAGDRAAAKAVVLKLEGAKKYDWLWLGDFDLLDEREAGAALATLGFGELYECWGGRRRLRLFPNWRAL